MSDSDSTIPAVDDFNSRFLEFDEYSEGQTEEDDVCAVSSQLDASSNSVSLSGSARSSTTRKSGTFKSNNLNRRRTSSQRTRRLSNPNVEDKGRTMEIDGEDDVEDEELSTLRNPKLLTARQMSLKSQRHASSTHKSSFTRTQSEATLLSLESFETPKSTTLLTPEQIAAHQKRVAHRRETAKHKAELEKRQTVERLLKINANSIGRRGRQRGRNARGPDLRIVHPSVSSTSLASDLNDSTTSVNEGSPDSSEAILDQKPKSIVDASESETIDEIPKFVSSTSDPSDTGLDKRFNQATRYGSGVLTCQSNTKYIRTISSVHLEPSKLVCFPQTTDIELQASTTLWNSKPIPPIPQSRLCELGCGRLRRYACAKTGRSLCSLACYKQNLSAVH